MKNNEEILTLFEKYLAQISLPEEPHRLYDPIIYSMSEGGKRIRPALLLLCCDAFGEMCRGAARSCRDRDVPQLHAAA